MSGETGVDLAAVAAELPEWTVTSATLTRSATAPTFPAAIAWVVAIADAAEERDHHPDIDIRWRTVNLTLSTHSAGHVTTKDVDLARAIEAIIAA